MTIPITWRDGDAFFAGLWVGSATLESDKVTHVVGWTRERPWRAFALLADQTQRRLVWSATEAEARAAVESAVDAAIGDERYPDWLTEHGVKQTAEGYRLREQQLTECLHFENALAAAFDPPSDCRSLAAWIIDTFAPPGAETRLDPFLKVWLAKERAR